MKKIVVLDDYEEAYRRLADWSAIERDAHVEYYSERMEGPDLLKAIKDANALVLMRDRTPLKADLIAQLPYLEYVVFTGTRNLALDVEALKQRQIPVSFTEWGPSKDSTSELSWAMLMALYKRVIEQNAVMMLGAWRNDRSLLPMLKGQTLGLIGLGEIGSRMARYAQAFGMRVLCWSPNMTAERAQAAGASAVALDQLMSESDIISLHIVAGPTTKGIVSKEKIALMKPSALLINTSRSVLVDTDALVNALRDEKIAGAALDVFDIEPLPIDHPLRDCPNTLLIPHLGFVAEDVFKTFSQGVVECLNAWLHGQSIVRPLP